MVKRIERVEIGELGEALQRILDEYHSDVLEGVNKASEDTAKKLVKLTKDTAPRGRRKKYWRYITYSEDTRNVGKFSGKTYIWHVKKPEYRLTHLLVHGHATRNGGRTRPNPFLHNAVDAVTPEYEAKIVEAIENGK